MDARAGDGDWGGSGTLTRGRVDPFAGGDACGRGPEWTRVEPVSGRVWSRGVDAGGRGPERTRATRCGGWEIGPQPQWASRPRGRGPTTVANGRLASAWDVRAAEARGTNQLLGLD